MREGLVLAVILVFAALGAGVLAVPRLPAGASPGASGAALASSSPALLSLPPSPSAVAPSPRVGPTPAVVPVAPCQSIGPSEGIIWPTVGAVSQWVGTPLTLTYMAQPLPPSPQGDPEGPEVAPGTTLFMLTGGVCALAWNITLNGAVVALQDNDLHDPAFAAQNYFVLTLPATRDADPRLRAELLYSLGWTVFEWTIHLRPTPIPEAFFSSLDQTIEAAPGCGFTITTDIGSTSADECATTIPPDGAGPFTLYVPPGSAVAFRAPSASFDSLDFGDLTCGSVSGTPPDFHVDSACLLEPDYDPSNALSFTAPATPGVWWVKVSGCASRAGHQACGLWFAIINTAEPMPSDPPEG
jgi:hypothetical protein